MVNIRINTATSKLYVKINGVNKQEAILLLHGGPGVPDYLDGVVKFFEDDFKVIRFDQRGVGNSEALNDSYTINDYLSDIDEVLKYIEVGRVHLFGHSWGGLLAQLWAAKNPHRTKSLFLCSPSSGTGAVWKQMEKEVMQYNKRQATQFEWISLGLNSMIAILGSNFGYQNIFRLLWKYYFKIPKQAPEASESWLDGIRAKAINATRKSIVNFDDEHIKIHKIPTIVTFGRYDIYGESREAVFHRIPNASRIVFENTGHLPWIQNEKDFIKVVDDFMKNSVLK